MHNENQKFWLICGWAASVLSQLIYWCAFIFRHNTIILSPGGRLHPAYTYAQVDAMMAQKLAPFDDLFAFCIDLMVPFLSLVLLFVIYEIHLSPKKPHHAPLFLRLGIVAAGLAFMQLLIYLNYHAEYYLLYMPAGKILVASLVWFAMCICEKIFKVKANKS